MNEINKHCFDMEYSTMNGNEKKFLDNKNIKYTFVKRDINNIATYKYKKTKELFEALIEFYYDK